MGSSGKRAGFESCASRVLAQNTGTLRRKMSIIESNLDKNDMQYDYNKILFV